MENKVELKKMLIISLVMFFILTGIFFGLNNLEYKRYTKVFNQKIAQIVQNIKKEYPESEISEIVKILNEEEKINADILKNYGINLEKEAIILENNIIFNKFIFLEMSLFCMLFIMLIIIFFRYNNKKDKKLKEITEYIEEINNKNYKLDIEDNTEDELSILKNEVYKTTVMLKEMAENSLKDKVKLKDSLSDISHQLKTPLTSIMILLDNMLEDKNMEEKTKEEFIKDIKREITNISFLINAILKLSKFDANAINFINKEEKISEILETVVQNISGICDLKNIEINIKGEKEEKIECDFKWQVEAITNILKNCVEHSFENSKIDIDYLKNSLYAKITIRDYGSGIDEKDLPHIFERFYKGKNSKDDSIRNRFGTC
ncbi:MAG: HAMP domain-containing histidine kinase [Clostridia bacterium]|jgi:signal transduction histidine kinase|nr:HAMP domain-containing histidine kinase [Clostridia bacterium]